MGVNNQLYLGLLSLHNQMKEEVQQNNTTKKVEVKHAKKILTQQKVRANKIKFNIKKRIIFKQLRRN